LIRGRSSIEATSLCSPKVTIELFCQLKVEADNVHLQFDYILILNHGANDGILDFAVVQVDADFVADLKFAVWFLGWHARNVP